MSTKVTHHSAAPPAPRPPAPHQPAADSHAAAPAHDSVHLSAAATSSASEAAKVYKPLTRDFGTSRKIDTYAHDKGGKRSYAWPIAQDMNAALDRGDTKAFDKLNTNLQRYRSGAHGYSSASNGQHGQGGKYYDDNAWIGLAQMQGYKKTGNKKYLDDAKSTFDFVKSGEYKGGLPWEQSGKGSKVWKTCSEAPAAELALQLHAAPGNTPKEGHDYLQFAKQMNNNLDAHMRQPNGLYQDTVDPHDPSHNSRAICSYNQGAVIGMKTQLYQATGDKSYLQQAQQTAKKSVNYLAKNNRLNKQGPAYNAIFYRNLAQLDAVAPNPRYQASLTSYANGLSGAVNPSSGLIRRSDILQQSGASQIFSLLAMPPSQYQYLT